MSDLIEELKLTTKSSDQRSKYRVIIESLLRYFDKNPKKNATKITCKMASEANGLSKKLKDWMTIEEEEKIIITQRGRVVYALRESDGEEKDK